MRLKVIVICRATHLSLINLDIGKHMKIDLCAMKQNGKESISFMSQSIGMMADVDLGTEYMRWMGDTRFMVGFFLAGTYGVLLLLTSSEILVRSLCVPRLSHEIGDQGRI